MSQIDFIKKAKAEKQRLSKSPNKVELARFEFSVVDEMSSAEATSKELAKQITSVMKTSTKMFKDMEKYAKNANKEINKMIKAYNAELKKGGSLKDKVEAQVKSNTDIFDKVVKGAKALGMDAEDIQGFKNFDKADNALLKAQGDDEYNYLGESLSDENWTVG